MSAKQQTIEDLAQRYAKLNTRKIQAETNLENAEKQLAKLKQQAIKEYGTDDVDELQKKLKQMEADNEAQRSKYQTSLDKIEADLAQVDADFEAASADEAEAPE